MHNPGLDLGLDAVREQALVEFAGLGAVGLRALDPSIDADALDDEGAALADALAAASSAGKQPSLCKNCTLPSDSASVRLSRTDNLERPPRSNHPSDRTGAWEVITIRPFMHIASTFPCWETRRF